MSASSIRSSIVWITSGKKGEPKHRIYTAYLDKVRVKTMGTLTSADLGHQNPEINSREELIADFERIYKRRILMEDTGDGHLFFGGPQ